MLFIVFAIILSVLIVLCTCKVSGDCTKSENNSELSDLIELILQKD